MTGMLDSSLTRRDRGDVDLERFAMRVVAGIAGKHPDRSGEPDKDLLRLLVRHARTGDPVVLRALFGHLERERISAEDVVDVHIPDAARSLGASWHAGDLDILETTLAISRLQALLRELGRAWSADHAETSSEARVILVVPQREQHTLGTLIVAQQLRRLGVSVNMQLMVSPAKLTVLLAESTYDAVFISVANRSNLELCKELVASAKRSIFRDSPVVLGGALPGVQNNVRELTGADVVTNDIGQALDACDLRAYNRAAQ
ncbi:cobalamin B12-binding domain-containing protein [Pararhodobacter sp. SW119]|uniref:cobalamin B12-binding domain-containing protein n=1 Tax=Pararhodobacter sp. SW119 TaxID=2780075 RepID=UPI001ADFFA1C|nr:cobalamin B12-binding domain-containing protein [Pararhodobacter sp. SW119]